MLVKILIWYLIASSGFFFCVGRGTSMEDTFADGQVLVLREVAAYSAAEAGDIVTFRVDRYGKLIKRVVAVVGDRVEVREHRLYINDLPTEIEGYVEEQPAQVIEDGYIFAVGDSYWSVDSRCLGPIAVEDIEDIYICKLPLILPAKKK